MQAYQVKQGEDAYWGLDAFCLFCARLRVSRFKAFSRHRKPPRLPFCNGAFRPLPVRAHPRARAPAHAYSPCPTCPPPHRRRPARTTPSVAAFVGAVARAGNHRYELTQAGLLQPGCADAADAALRTAWANGVAQEPRPVSYGTHHRRNRAVSESSYFSRVVDFLLAMEQAATNTGSLSRQFAVILQHHPAESVQHSHNASTL
ncbi:hypothetical protein SPI_02014 [Niveomyces insectorum RCEF 264]|uniref:Uncharacterized protein n=1 Tax=Niveomyces insectorum RCEF 264 TaxID=1081102 RepID=A0A167XPJ9_9HYPO|nr:hypothetical protein SPI_02014 [Niveomyces insectorum RCEF 264]